MAYSHSNWRLETTDAAKLAKLDLHLSEVAGQMGIDTSAADHSVNRKELVNYYESLKTERAELAESVNAGQRVLFSRARFWR